MKITRHAKLRLKERLGLNKSASVNLAKKAFKDGICKNNAKSILKDYFNELYRQSEHNIIIKIYGEFVWIFDKHKKLITVFKLRNEMKKYVKLVNK